MTRKVADLDGSLSSSGLLASKRPRQCGVSPVVEGRGGLVPFPHSTSCVRRHAAEPAFQRRGDDLLRQTLAHTAVRTRNGASPAGKHRTIAVGTLITGRPPHRTVRAAFLHTAPTSDD